MKTYDVQVEWSGYSRGYSVYRVEAESEEKAREFWYEGERRVHETVRDDTETEGYKEVTPVHDVSTKKS